MLPPHSILNSPEVSRKIREACAVARAAGFRLIWIDSCCIGKTSSSELSEAINSMFAWYAGAQVCYAYLADVSQVENHHSAHSRFRKSTWFTRGWTLQELIAPFHVTLLSQDWQVIGSKRDLVDLIEGITGISGEALLHETHLNAFSVAQRLSWAATRKTTRPEDQAYSLLGIFDINMPTLYGEGERAFRRLQEEIIRRIPDQSLFAWGYVYQDCRMLSESLTALPREQSLRFRCSTYNAQFGSSLFARTLNALGEGGKIRVVSHDHVFRRLQLSHLPAPEYAPTPHGIRTQIPVIPISLYIPQNLTVHPGDFPPFRWYLAILGCELINRPEHLLGRVCYISPSESGVEILHPGYVQVSPRAKAHGRHPELFPLSPSLIDRCRSQIELKMVYISHPDHANRKLQAAKSHPHKTIELAMMRKRRDALRAQGYETELRGPDRDHPATHTLTLSNDNHTITIVCQHHLEADGAKLSFDAHAKMSGPILGPGDGREVQGRPRMLVWSDRMPWESSLASKDVAFGVARTTVLVVKLGLQFAWRSLYFLDVQVLHGAGAPGAASSAVTQRATEAGADGPAVATGSQATELDLIGELGDVSVGTLVGTLEGQSSGSSTVDGTVEAGDNQGKPGSGCEAEWGMFEGLFDQCETGEQASS